MSIQLFSVNKEVTPEQIADAISNYSFQLESTNQAIIEAHCNRHPSANIDDANRLSWLIYAQQSLIEQQRMLCAHWDSMELPVAPAKTFMQTLKGWFV